MVCPNMPSFDIPHTSFLVPSWGRLALTILVVPMMIISCGTAPQFKSSPDYPEITIAPVTHPQAYYHFLRGYLAEINHDSSIALQEYRQGLKYDPNSAYLRIRIARIHFANGELSEAAKVADQISIERLTNTQDLIRLAKIYAGTGNSDRALTLFDEALRREPDNSEAYIAKGVLLLSLKRLDEAERVFETSLEQLPFLPQSHYYLAQIAKERKRFDEAERHFKKAIEQKPNFERAYRGLASLYEEKMEPAKAIALYEDFLKTVNPHHKEFRLQLVRLHIRGKSYDKALDQLAFILEDNPDDLSAPGSKSLYFRRNGQLPTGSRRSEEYPENAP